MARDLTLFPENNIGEALWKMLAEGDDLTKEREIEFSILFPSEAQALKFGQLLLENNQKLSFCAYPDDKDYPWEITAYPIIAATFENITAYQDLLESSAQAFKGKYDGWYCVNAAKLPY